MFKIHLILNQFDDGKQQVCISQPAEYIFKGTEVFVLHTFCDAVRERGKHDYRYGRQLRFHVSGYVEHIIIVRTRHTDNEVEIILLHIANHIVLIRGTEETRWIAQT